MVEAVAGRGAAAAAAAGPFLAGVRGDGSSFVVAKSGRLKKAVMRGGGMPGSSRAVDQLRWWRLVLAIQSLWHQDPVEHTRRARVAVATKSHDRGALSAVFVSYDLFPQRDILGFERSLIRVYDSLLLEAMFCDSRRGCEPW